MTAKSTSFEREFVNFAQQLSNHFPSLDLRFNHAAGTGAVRYAAADVSESMFELNLESGSVRDLVNQAILTIKEVAQKFDA